MNRRDFLRSAAIAGAGVALAPAARAQAAGGGGNGDVLQLGIIGTGTQGRVLIQDSVRTRSVRFRAVCDIWPWAQGYAARRLRRQGAVNRYADYREMLAKEKGLDAVLVATPDWMHAEHTVACLEAGLHVYCEKEMSHRLEDARRMVLAARKTGKVLQIGHQRRSNPVYQQALAAIDDDDLCGRLTSAYGQWNRPVQPKLTWREKDAVPKDVLAKYGYASMDELRNWRWFRKCSAGPIADLGSHQIDIFDWFFHAHPASLIGSGGKDYYADREWYEDVMVIYEYAYRHKSARAFYQVRNTNGFGNYFERFAGDGGTLTLSENDKACLYVPEPGKAPPKWTEGVEPVTVGTTQAIPVIAALKSRSPAAQKLLTAFEAKNLHQVHLENFFAAARAGDPGKLTCPPEVAYPTAVAVLNVIPAIESGKKRVFEKSEFKA